MAWVVDTCVLLDILDEISPFAEVAAEALDAKAEDGTLTIAPITYVELAPAFNGDRGMQDLFLRHVGINNLQPRFVDYMTNGTTSDLEAGNERTENHKTIRTYHATRPQLLLFCFHTVTPKYVIITVSNERTSSK